MQSVHAVECVAVRPVACIHAPNTFNNCSVSGGVPSAFDLTAVCGSHVHDLRPLLDGGYIHMYRGWTDRIGWVYIDCIHECCTVWRELIARHRRNHRCIIDVAHTHPTHMSWCHISQEVEDSKKPTDYSPPKPPLPPSKRRRLRQIRPHHICGRYRMSLMRAIAYTHM